MTFLEAETWQELLESIMSSSHGYRVANYFEMREVSFISSRPAVDHPNTLFIENGKDLGPTRKQLSELSVSGDF